MRARSLVILIVVVAAAAYVYFFQWHFVTGLTEDIRLNMAGYTAAKSPEDAMDKFSKAIKARDYNAAARYCTKAYADNLIKGKTAGYQIGSRVDQLINLMKDKDLQHDRSLTALYALDPFPPMFERASDRKIEEIKKGEPKMGAWIKMEPPNFTVDLKVFEKMDQKMFQNALRPITFPITTPVFSVVLVPDGPADNKTWKLDIPLDDATKDKTNYFVEHYKGYSETLDNLIDLIRREPYDSKGKFADVVVDKFAARNEK